MESIIFSLLSFIVGFGVGSLLVLVAMKSYVNYDKSQYKQAIKDLSRQNRDLLDMIVEEEKKANLNRT